MTTVGNITFGPSSISGLPPRHWDSAARRYVEHDTLPQETFSVLARYDRAAFDSGVDLAAVPAANDNDRGPYVITLNGRFYPLAPRPEDVRIVDIAHGLAMATRYGGAGRRYYSTAEHSVHIARWILARGYHPIVAMAGLLHDAPEPLSGFGDIVRPMKDRVPLVKQTEAKIWREAIAPAFGLSPEGQPVIVHEADSRIVKDEMSQNACEVDPAYAELVPLGVMLRFWPHDQAELYFLDTFKKLLLAIDAEKMRVDW